MHDCPVSTGDSWARSHLDAYAQWAKTRNSLLIVTFDEDDSVGPGAGVAQAAGAARGPARHSGPGGSDRRPIES
jgi:acid phosphatase